MTSYREQRLREALEARQKASEQKQGSLGDQWRRFANTAVFFTAVIILFILSVAIWKDYRGWADSAGDPSARSAYVTFFEVNVAEVVLTIGAAALATWLLRRK